MKHLASHHLLLLAAASLCGCGPYAELAQKLDVGAIISGGETWVSVQGDEVRVLLLGAPAEGGQRAGFAFTAMSFPITAGTAARAYQGSWSGDAGAPTLELHEELAYVMDDERGKDLLQRYGATRESVDETLTFDQFRGGDRLVLTGDGSIAGTYVLLPRALASLGTTSPDDAACAFQVANLAVLSSEVRIIGFGSALMTQYSKSTGTFQGTRQGEVLVSVHGSSLSPTTDVIYTQFADFDGVQIDGTQTTHVNARGDGEMSGTVTFRLVPEASPAVPEIAGAIAYGAPGNPDDPVQISSGSPTGGTYLVSLTGGATATLAPAGTPSPALAACLGLSSP